MSGFGPVHKLIVRRVGEDDEPFHVNEFEDYDIEHPSDCQQEEVQDPDGNVAYTVYRCGVSHNVDGAGARWSLRYSGTPVTEPGVYQIRAWSEVYRGFDYIEHDGGIGLVQPDEQP